MALLLAPALAAGFFFLLESLPSSSSSLDELLLNDPSLSDVTSSINESSSVSSYRYGNNKTNRYARHIAMVTIKQIIMLIILLW